MQTDRERCWRSNKKIKRKIKTKTTYRNAKNMDLGIETHN